MSIVVMLQIYGNLIQILLSRFNRDVKILFNFRFVHIIMGVCVCDVKKLIEILWNIK